MDYQWILFDADNTLLDFDRCQAWALQKAVESIGWVYEESFNDVYTFYNKQCWRDFENGLISKEKLRTERFRVFFDKLGIIADPAEFEKTYLGFLGHTGFLLTGALDMLKNLHGRKKLAIITNGLKEVQRPRLKEAGLSAFFETIVVSDEIGKHKPDPAFFEYTFNELDHPPKENTIVVGDNLNSDIRGGHDFGVATCWFNPGGKRNPTDILPTYEVSSFVELGKILK